MSQPLSRLSVLLLFAASLHAQSIPNVLGSKAAGSSSQVEDPLKRTTPQSAMRGFLQACHNQSYVRASEFLDMQNLPPRQRLVQGPELARHLSEVLNRDSHFELSSLSDQPEGEARDGLNPDRDLLASIPVNGSHVDLYLQREPDKHSDEIWLVSQDSLAKLPQLSAFSGRSPLEEKLPRPLVSIEFLGTSLGIWLALIFVALIISLFSRLLSRLVIILVKPIVSRYSKNLAIYRLSTFVEPVRLLVAISVFRAAIEVLDPSALVRDYLLKMLMLLFALGAASVIMRVIDVIFDHVQTRLDSRERDLLFSILPLGVRLLKIAIFCVFGIFVLGAWGYNTTTILAGVGVGGLAIALAAQKTIENFFGGVSVVTDRPVLVGDFCKFGGQVGTVEDIGLRSTRIRTLERTLVTIPNSQFSTMTLENYSRRDRMWFHPTLHLRRGTNADQVTEFMQAIIDILKNDPLISIGNVPLRFTEIKQQSLEIEIFAYILTDDFDAFLAFQTKLLLQILKAAEQKGISFALPITESINIPAPSSPAIPSLP